MTTVAETIPTETSAIQAVLKDDQIVADYLSCAPSQRAYLAALLHCGTVTAAAEHAGVSTSSVEAWRSPSRDGATFRRVEQAFRAQRDELSMALAVRTLRAGAASAAHQMVQVATAPDDGPRTMPTRQRARETILEAVGVIQRAPAVAVQVNNQASDPTAIRQQLEDTQAQLADIRREREALERVLAQHNSAQSSQSALPQPSPDTNGEHNEAT